MATQKAQGEASPPAHLRAGLKRATIVPLSIPPARPRAGLKRATIALLSIPSCTAQGRLEEGNHRVPYPYPPARHNPDFYIARRACLDSVAPHGSAVCRREDPGAFSPPCVAKAPQGACRRTGVTVRQTVLPARAAQDAPSARPDSERAPSMPVRFASARRIA